MTVLAGVREDSTFLTSIAPGMPLSLSATVKVDTCKVDTGLRTAYETA